MGVSTAIETQPSTETIPPIVEEEEVDAEPIPELDDIFTKASEAKLKEEEVDAFWDSLVAESSGEVSRADVISYDQARQLGLAPEE
jgi:hypothetical protein